MQRNFSAWFSTFRESIATYSYYVDFRKVYSNVESIKVELNILNSLINSKNIKSDFEEIIIKYPETLKCIPILLAVRNLEIPIMDDAEFLNFNFSHPVLSTKEYAEFMDRSGLFDLLQNHLINNLINASFKTYTTLFPFSKSGIRKITISKQKSDSNFSFSATKDLYNFCLPGSIKKTRNILCPVLQSFPYPCTQNSVDTA